MKRGQSRALTMKRGEPQPAPRSQDHGHRLAAPSLIDVDRQEAAAVVVGMEERQLLLAVHPVDGIVDVQNDAPRHLRKAVAEQLDHGRHHALERGQTPYALR